MDGYELLARCYNRFTRDVDYAALASYVQAVFAREEASPGISALTNQPMQKFPRLANTRVWGTK